MYISIIVCVSPSVYLYYILLCICVHLSIQKFIRYMDLLFHGGANAGAVVTSFLCIVFLIVMDYVNMFIKKKFPRFPFPIPSQIILVMLHKMVLLFVGCV